MKFAIKILCSFIFISCVKQDNIERDNNLVKENELFFEVQESENLVQVIDSIDFDEITLLSERITILLPSEFGLMRSEMLSLKYPIID